MRCFNNKQQTKKKFCLLKMEERGLSLGEEQVDAITRQNAKIANYEDSVVCFLFFVFCFLFFVFCFCFLFFVFCFLFFVFCFLLFVFLFILVVILFSFIFLYSFFFLSISIQASLFSAIRKQKEAQEEVTLLEEKVRKKIKKR